MSKTTSQAKRETFIEQLESGAIKTKTARVLSHIRSWRYSEQLLTTEDLRNHLHYSHQTLTAILSNLLDLGMIKITGTVRTPGGTFSSYEYVINKEEQIKLERERKAEKYEQWLKRGLEDFNDLMPISLFMELHEAQSWFILSRVNKK
jgi:predicted transcriptional regulator